MPAPRLVTLWKQCSSQPLTLASIILLSVTAISSLRFLIVPNLRRLHLQVNLTLFDYGFYGFYPTRDYVSVEYKSPDVEIAQWDAECSHDYVFIAPHGNAVEDPAAMILDSRGNLVWMMPFFDGAQDFRVQEYLGAKYLTYWHGRGSWSMLDSSYIHRFEIEPVGNFDGNMHDLRITENGTALITIYETIPTDLSTIGGPLYGYIRDCLFQEIEVGTGKLLFQWRISDHVPFDSSFKEIKGSGWDRDDAYDAYHVNSIDKDQFGNYLLSSRHTHSILSIDGKSGEILWTLGGKFNDFIDISEGKATDFAWQHDARWHDDYTLTLLDNTAEWFLDGPTQSRAMTLELDVPNRVARLRATYFHPEGIRATSQGNVQVLSESGNVFVGWGHCAAYTEFSKNGRVLCDTHFGPSNWFQLGQVVSYRVTKSSWIGRPNTIPAAAVIGSSVFVSWNGATEVVAWRLELWDGFSIDDMQFDPSKVVKKDGFETEIELPPDLSTVYYRVVALNDQYDILGMTEVLGKQQNWAFRDLVQSYVGLFSQGVGLSIFMLGCSFLLVAYWAFKKCACPFISHHYRLVPSNINENGEDEVSLSPL
ncbi:hypothetical protein N7474_008242 [Penicillium riverlandense]|uniref:uncharacterized protein n=1 Tax=Penicillium riverlandense TaxID=1903569 RepID=UPI00254869C9|nr:uncharacterized protein N7474_008242 [Penicillium riverlandense]KAJ5811941.1 hypothetical protein N7474_008242 [Penicillium riverlandense]